MRAVSHEQAARGGMTIGQLIRHGKARLAQAGIENAEQETLWLLESALQMDRLQLSLHKSQEVQTETSRRAESLLARRADREPLQYLLGTQEFCGLQFAVEPGVLIPRPETELLVDEVVRAVRTMDQDVPVIADIGTGSGCLAVTLATILPTAKVIAIDCSMEALRVARRNAQQHGVVAHITFEQGELLQPLRATGMRDLSVIVSNPPYVPDGEWETLQPEVRREPKIALAGGHDGLECHRQLVEQAAEFLQPCGYLIMEVGIGQAAMLSRLIGGDSRYEDTWVKQDDAGIERIVAARKR